MNKIILLTKSLVAGYHRKDGTYVKPHHRKGSAAAKPGAGQLALFQAPARPSLTPNPFKGLDPVKATGDLFEDLPPVQETTKKDPEAELRALWDKQGVPKEKQDELIAGIADKAKPGAKVGPFTVPEDAKKPGFSADAPVEDFRLDPQQYDSWAYVLPGVGRSFSDEQKRSMVQWFKDAGWNSKINDKGRIVVFTSGSGDGAKLSDIPVSPAQRRRAEKARADMEASQNAASEKQEKEQAVQDTDAFSFVDKLLGDEANAFNKRALAKYLNGESKQFEGIAGSGWVDKLKQAGVKIGDGSPKAMAEGIKAAFSKPEPRVLLTKPAKAGDPTETPEFKRWFGDSKVVDENGKPLLVYHGTNAEFTEFDPGKRGSNTDWDNTSLGFFFIADRKLAENFLAETSGGNRIVDAYLSIQKPLRLTQQEIFTNREQAPTLAEIFFGERMDPDEALQMIDEEIDLGNYSEISEALRGEDARRVMERDGFDGVISHFGGGNLEYVAFHPEQIKSASGNSGAFDPKSRDMTKALS